MWERLLLTHGIATRHDTWSMKTEERGKKLNTRFITQLLRGYGRAPLLVLTPKFKIFILTPGYMLCVWFV